MVLLELSFPPYRELAIEPFVGVYAGAWASTLWHPLRRGRTSPQNVDEPTWIPISGDDQTHKHAREALALMQLAYDSDHGRAEEWNQLLRAVRAHQCGPEFWITQPVDSKLVFGFTGCRSLWGFPSKTFGHDGGYITYESSLRLTSLFWAVGFGDGVTDFTVTAVIPIIYGSLHFLGWHAHFPTMTEQRLWHIAAVGVVSAGACSSVLIISFAWIVWLLENGGFAH